MVTTDALACYLQSQSSCISSSSFVSSKADSKYPILLTLGEGDYGKFFIGIKNN